MPPAGTKGGKRTVRDLFARQKELAAMEQATMGVTYEEIAATAGPWGARMYADGGGAFKAVQRVLRRRASESAHNVEELRQIQGDRYNDLYRRSVEVMDANHPLIAKGEIVGVDHAVTLSAVNAGAGVLGRFDRLYGSADRGALVGVDG
jgi:hypothetical protein